MIESISGRLASLNPAAAVVETAGGVGYLLNITLPTFSRLEGAGEVRLLVHESVRDDAWVLYGFLDEAERELFRALIGVSGVGAGSARLILSAIPATELGAVIAAGDAKRLKAVKGIGAKTADRIIVDLRDKLRTAGLAEAAAGSAARPARPTSAAADEAVEALVILGFPRPASRKAVDKLYADDPTLTIEATVKKAMSML